MGKTASETVARSRKKSDVRRRVLNLTPEEDAILQSLKGDYGSMKGAVMAGLAKLTEQGRISKADVLAWIERMPD